MKFTKNNLLIATAVLTISVALSACNAPQEIETLDVDPTSKLLTIARMYESPSLSGASINRVQIAPNGKTVTMLRGREDDYNQKDLWSYDLETGESVMLVSSTDLLAGPEVYSEEEKNRRERARQHGRGITSYKWDEKGEQILFPLGGDVYVYNLAHRKAVQVTKTDGYETDARISKSGRYISYVRDNELYVNDLTTGKERRLSFGATDIIRNATASFVVQEELGRATGYWMAPDETRFAYTQIDESPIAIEERIDFTAQGVKSISQRYPFAGTNNAKVKLGIVSAHGGYTKWVDIGDDEDIYLSRVTWSEDAQHVYASVLTRDNKHLRVYDINPQTGESHVILEETSKTWVNPESVLRPLKDGSFIWDSERDGYKHLYHYKAGDAAPKQITKGNWPVSRVNCIDEDNQKLYFSGWQKTSLERHIYSVNFDGTHMTQISKGEGRHGAQFSENCSAYIGRFSNQSTPNQIRTFTNTGEPLIWLNENKLDETHPYFPYMNSHHIPQFGQLAAEDGSMMNYALYKPKDIKAGERRPAITLVYGGPHAQKVRNGWGGASLAQILVDKGFVVFEMDNRGTGNRGKAFEDHFYRAMGKIEVTDQTVGAKFLKNLGFVDPERMGIYGWSYGGYLTLHMLAQTNLYAVGVAGAPVTDWRLYDTAYTERYMGSPKEDSPNYTKGAYEHGDVLTHLEGLIEPFLLLHGMADDNVVFRNSIMLMDKMQKLGRHNMSVMTYPGEKHSFRSTANKTHRDTQIVSYFVKTLGEKSTSH
ncbi:MAG: S9 family peptidase [Robiginitomaculum sp.]|nr:MAG: S9 family peptidase [Robiginitomaculum sp.]